MVTRDDLSTFYYYQPAVQKVSVIDVKVPANLKVGYIMGAGDDIPEVLRQVGLDVTIISADKLASEIPSGEWRRLSAGAGSKGERLHDWALLPLFFTWPATTASARSLRATFATSSSVGRRM